MDHIPIRDGDRPDNVVLLPGGRAEAPVEPTSPSAGPASEPALGLLVEQSARIIAGFVSAVATALSDALREVTPHSATEDDELEDDEPAPPTTFALAAGATAGLALEVSRAAVRAATTFAETAGPVLSWFVYAPVIRRGAMDIEQAARELNERWSRERPVSEETASAFASKVIPELTSAILDHIDLTQLAIDRIDIERIVDAIDLDAIVARVDIDAVIDRVDLVAITYQLIEEIDLPELIRESTGAVTSETVRSVRMQSAQADLLLARAVDRLLHRRSRRGSDAEESGS
jgi:hypothetical protein